MFNKSFSNLMFFFSYFSKVEIFKSFNLFNTLLMFFIVLMLTLLLAGFITSNISFVELKLIPLKMQTFLSSSLLYLVSCKMTAEYLYLFMGVVSIYSSFCIGSWLYKGNLGASFVDWCFLGLYVIMFIFSYLLMFKWVYEASPWSDSLIFVIYFMFLIIWFLMFLGFNIKKNLFPTWVLMVIFLLLSFLGALVLHHALNTTSFHISVEKLTVLILLWDAYLQAGGGMGPSASTKEVEAHFLDENGKLPSFWPKDKNPKKEKFVDLMWATSMDPKSCEDFAFFVAEHSKKGSGLKASVNSTY